MKTIFSSTLASILYYNFILYFSLRASRNIVGNSSRIKLLEIVTDKKNKSKRLLIYFPYLYVLENT